ncbi:MAG: PIN domain-containing protein [Christensenellaceae bacterium]|jgi:hypothetical protein|nr:PIN domain-containing protein [Christensenellaceae bacterium]
MTTFDVFLDTNIFVKAKYNFYGASLDALRKYCDDGIAAMFSNDIIIREVKRHINTDVLLTARQAKNTIKDHGELKNAITPEVFKIIEKALLVAPQKLETAFDYYMNGTVLLSNAGLSLISLFDDYFMPRAPFENSKEKKSEFPDAAVIMSIKQYLTEKETTLHIVTDDNGWRDALKDFPGAVMHSELKSLLTEISKQKEIFEQVTSFVGEKIASLQECAKDWLRDQDWDFAGDEFEPCVECDEIDEVDVRDVSLVLDGIEYIDNTDGYAIATLSGIAKIKISFSYIDHTEEIYDKEDHVWYNTAYGDGVAEIEIPMDLSVTVILPAKNGDEFELDVPEFNDLNKASSETIEFELTENKEDFHDPYFGLCPDCGKKIGLHNDGGNGFCTDCAPRH